MSLKNKYEKVITRNNMSLGLSSCAYEYLLNLEQENQQLEEQLEQATKSTINSHKYASSTEDKLIDLENQLKQGDKVIDETIEFLVKILDRKAFVYSDLRKLVEILQKYKGDNNDRTRSC